MGERRNKGRERDRDGPVYPCSVKQLNLALANDDQLAMFCLSDRHFIILTEVRIVVIGIVQNVRYISLRVAINFKETFAH